MNCIIMMVLLTLGFCPYTTNSAKISVEMIKPREDIKKCLRWRYCLPELNPIIKEQSPSPQCRTRANRRIAKCTHIRIMHNAAQDDESQQNRCQVHTHSQLRTMRHRTMGANRTNTKCTHIRSYAQCSTGQWEPTEQAPSAHTFAVTHNAAQDDGSQQNKHQVHTHSHYAQCGTGQLNQHQKVQPRHW